MSSGIANYLRNKIVDWFHRGQTFVPPATIYIALVSTTPTPGGAGTPLSGTGYARVGIASDATHWASTNGATTTTTPSTGTTGLTSNNGVVDFGTAGAAWGTASHWEAYDALSGGNRLFWGEIVDGTGVATPRAIVLGDPVSFPISALQVQWP